MKKSTVIAGAFILCVLLSCEKSEEYSLEEFEALHPAGLNELLAKTVSKPWEGQDFISGKLGGTWHDVMSADPKSFNLLVSERDSATGAVVRSMHDYLIDYDPVAREWKPRAASFEVKVDEAAGKLSVIFTLRDNLYWSYYNSATKIPVTSDDVIFWYNEIEGDPEFQSSGYYQQFLSMEDGSEAHVDIEKLSGRSFALHFPRIVADPLLASNMDFGPAHIYKKAKDEKGVQGVLDLFSVAADPKTIPSMGEWFLTEYIPGQRLVYKRNPDYWNVDKAGLSIPYIEENIVQIIPDENTQKLIFLEGRTESYGLRPEDLDELVNKANADYTVFSNEGALSAAYWTFNQNPVHRDSPKYAWFTKKEFRQAMSCLLNRDRIIAQVYRGLAEAKTDFFPEPNAFYNPDIKLKYLYDREKALKLLRSAGFKQDNNGLMRDSVGNTVEFDLTIRSESTIITDIASIIMNELDQVGIKVNIRTLDFQKLVEQLFTTFEWDSVIMGLSGSNIFPSQGSNVWPSSGNLHMWYPQQPEPATDWEARVDYLYNEGSYTIDKVKAKRIWDEYQEIMLEQLPVISLLRPRGFWALRQRWDFSNVYYDNINGAETSYIFLK
ncbi:ABC transporter substrate-binding protein [Spirochaetia bacterium]|nr:ABC transporter substrate-binding protein [Spirochaetia bacterium]